MVPFILNVTSVKIGCHNVSYVKYSTGRHLEGIHYAMNFLETWQKQQHGDSIPYISAKDKDVIVVGGGDTGCDCIATSLRQVGNASSKILAIDLAT